MAERTLVALLASPPTTSGVRTRSRLAHALPLTGCSRLVIANLYAEPTRDVPALNATTAVGWHAARAELSASVQLADELLAGWGLLKLVGPAGALQADQVQWLLLQATSAGHDRLWAVGGQPRHPSRWHQFVSERHGRANGGEFAERLRHVLLPTPVARFSPEPADRTREAGKLSRAIDGKRLAVTVSDGRGSVPRADRELGA